MRGAQGVHQRVKMDQNFFRVLLQNEVLSVPRRVKKVYMRVSMAFFHRFGPMRGAQGVPQIVKKDQNFFRV